jgi:hypothetical protein
MLDAEPMRPVERPAAGKRPFAAISRRKDLKTFWFSDIQVVFGQRGNKS